MYLMDAVEAPPRFHGELKQRLELWEVSCGLPRIRKRRGKAAILRGAGYAAGSFQSASAPMPSGCQVTVILR